MRLGDLPRTTSFRLAVLFLALFGLAALALFGILYWKTASYRESGIDAWLVKETASLIASSPAERIRRLNERALIELEGRRLFALFDAGGSPIAGNLPALPVASPPLDQPFEFSLRRGGETTPFLGFVHRLPSGEVLLVGDIVRGMHEFHQLLRAAVVWGAPLVVVIGLVGAVLAGAGALRRIDAVTRAIERIVHGNLADRLPTRGQAGDLDRLVHVVNGMLDEIERLMHEVKGVSDGIAHDLRTPLTRLLAGLERARRRAASADEYAAAVDEAIVETTGVLSTFGAMLRISEVEDGARRAGFTTVDLVTLAADVAEFYEPLAEGQGLSLSLEAEGEGAAEMAGDASLLFEAIANIVDNAIKFTPAGGRVTVRVFRGTETLGIAVTDTGPGIPAAERDAVLRRFYRAERSRHTPGTGLGLSLVAAVARLHCLQLVIEDAEPGCRVTLRRGCDASPGTQLAGGALYPARSPAQLDHVPDPQG